MLRNVPFLDPNGRSRKPAVLHDYLYHAGRLRVFDRRAADDLLRVALRSEGASAAVAWAFWRGVRLGGWLAWGK